MGISSSAYEFVKRSAMDITRRSNSSDKYQFNNRSKGLKKLIIVLAGYKQPLWPMVFPRLAKAAPEDADVCVMSAGKYVEALASLCEERGWSYLSSGTNDVSLVQNVTINLHPAATFIVKVDEDMFVTDTTINKIVSYYEAIKSSSIVNPSLVAPMINVNGVCYRTLLSRLGLLAQYEARFGPARVTTVGAPISDDPEACRWIWEHTVPLERTEAQLVGLTGDLMMAPVQFSIGLIGFERSFWNEIGGFPVKRHMLAMKRSTLGADEEYICRMATFLGRPVVICQDAFAAHFAFGPQYAGMLKFLDERPEIFAA